MVALGALWLPILLAAVVVFIASSIIHMVLTYHRADIRALPNEAAVAAALRPLNIPPGDYVIPYCKTMAETKSPEYQEKLAKGPVGMFTILPNGPFTMGKSLVQWFILSLVISLFAAYVAAHALAPGADYLAVFRFAGTTAFAGYALGLPQASIWGGRNWGTTVRGMIDGLIYAGLTGGVMGWLWPS
jgi:hypothetical protein